MKRIVITAGLACVMALPGFASAQSATPSGQGEKKPGAQGTTSTKPGGAGGQAGAGASAAGTLAAADRTFAMHAAQGGLAEVEMGKVAASNADSPDVKQFGQRMVDDHGKANTELMSWASKNNVTLPTEPDAKQKAEHARLSKLSGAAFDTAYMKVMVADHNKDVAEFQREAKTAKDADLKSWVTKTLPTLQEHQTMAKEINAKVGGGAAKTGTGAKTPGAKTPGAKPAPGDKN